MPQQFRAAWADLREGLGLWRAWTLFAWGNLTRPYRRTFIGPLWEPIGLLLFVLMLGPIYSHPFGMSGETYMVYLAAGWSCWQLVSGFISSGANSLVQAIGMLQQSRLPVTLFFFETLTTELLEFLTKIALVLLLLLAFNSPVGASTLLVLPNLLLLLVTGLGLIAFFGLICARFPDFRPVVQIAMRLAFFITPILWHANVLAGGEDAAKAGAGAVRAAYVDFNPLYHMLELVRAPLLDTTPERYSYSFVILLTLGVWLAAGLLFLRWRSRVVYWG